MRIDRMLSILVILLNKDRVSACELAEKFEVSVRTVYRDIEAINLAGIPIISYSGNGGGFGIMDTFKLDRQLFNLRDMLNVLSALKGVNSALNDKELDSAIEKISSLVPKDKTDELNLHLEQIVMDIHPWGFSKNLKEYVKKIHESINNSKVISFSYFNLKGEKTNRSIEPMTLVFKGYTWYLFGYCLLKNDYRLFRLSRIKNLKTTDKSFRRKNVSYHDYKEPDLAAMKMVDLVLRFNKEMLLRIGEYFPENAISFTKSGDLIVKISFPEDEWIYGFILSFGNMVEILEPEYIRSGIEKRIEKMQSFYKPDIMVS